MYFFKRLFFLQAFLAALFIQSANSAAPNYDMAREAGDVLGVVQLCQSSVFDAQVYVRGSSFAARTDSQGRFKISYMQEGLYDLVVRNSNGILGTIPQIQVLKKQTVDVGVHDFCIDLDGDGFTPPQDCDDSNPSINPGATDICGDGIDNDCSGAADEGCVVCTDNDGDLFFAQANCGTPIDCDDSNVAINPLATEVCDGLDNDCDFVVDESGAIGEQTYYLDNDGDIFGDDATVIQACSAPANYTFQGGDCDDNDSGTYPGALELIGDGRDNNCDGRVDEGDFDSDGYEGIAGGGDDCNDSDPLVHPNQVGYFSSPSNHTPGFDYDCNGSEDKQDPALANYSESSVFSIEFCTVNTIGWKDFVPNCGQTGNYFYNTMDSATGTCFSKTQQRVQFCH